jgi:hypothetical protein
VAGVELRVHKRIWHPNLDGAPGRTDKARSPRGKPAGASAPGCAAPGNREIIRRQKNGCEALVPMAIPRHGLHGATVAVIGNRVHMPGGGPVPGGSIQGAYHDAFTFG